MILDSFKFEKLIVQAQYEKAFQIWDRAGAISTELCVVWPGTDVFDAKPQQQLLKSDSVQLETGIDKATATLFSVGSLDTKKIQQINDSFRVWKTHLEIKTFKRFSARATFTKDFKSISEANQWLFSLNLIKRPAEKAFDQPIETEKNSFSLSYRFEDSISFALLDIKSEQLLYEVKLDRSFTDQQDIKGEKNRVVIEFDRGILERIDSDNFRVDDWIKGFQHVLRRDIGKVLGESP
jgi:hypothetical protein